MDTEGRGQEAADSGSDSKFGEKSGCKRRSVLFQMPGQVLSLRRHGVPGVTSKWDRQSLGNIDPTDWVMEQIHAIHSFIHLILTESAMNQVLVKEQGYDREQVRLKSWSLWS